MEWLWARNRWRWAQPLSPTWLLARFSDFSWDCRFCSSRSAPSSEIRLFSRFTSPSHRICSKADEKQLMYLSPSFKLLLLYKVLHFQQAPFLSEQTYFTRQNVLHFLALNHYRSSGFGILHHLNFNNSTWFCSSTLSIFLYRL